LESKADKWIEFIRISAQEVTGVDLQIAVNGIIAMGAVVAH
jgi:hypothetical protein